MKPPGWTDAQWLICQARHRQNRAKKAARLRMTVEEMDADASAYRKYCAIERRTAASLNPRMGFALGSPLLHIDYHDPEGELG